MNELNSSAQADAAASGHFEPFVKIAKPRKMMPEKHSPAIAIESSVSVIFFTLPAPFTGKFYLSSVEMPLSAAVRPASPCNSLGMMIFVALPSAAFAKASRDFS